MCFLSSSSSRALTSAPSLSGSNNKPRPQPQFHCPVDSLQYQTTPVTSMADSQLDEAQQRAVKLLSDNILNPRILLKLCLLDNGRHSLEPKFSLGALELLPTEMLHEVLGHVNVASLLLFRCVNQQAMASVDEMVEYKKVRLLLHAVE
jgi:hypothetical protein